MFVFASSAVSPAFVFFPVADGDDDDDDDDDAGEKISCLEWEIPLALQEAGDQNLILFVF